MPDQEFAHLARRIRRAALELRFHALRHRKFDPDQPRVLAGNEGGGQWTDGGGGGGGGQSPRRADGPSSRPRRTKPPEERKPAEWRLVRSEKLADGERRRYSAADGARVLSERRRGAFSGRESSRHIVALPDGSSLGIETGFDGVQRIYGKDGALVAASRWGKYGPEPVAVAQPASHLTTPPPSGFGGSASQALQHLQAAIALHGQMAQALVQGRPVLSIRAEEYAGSSGRTEALEFVGSVSEEDIDRACPRHGEVRSFTNTAADELRSLYVGKPREFGTAVHSKIKHQVNNRKLEDFVAEDSILKAKEAYGELAYAKYGTKATLRIDVLERLPNNTVCVYGIKAGKSGLSPARIREIAQAVYRRYQDAERFLIIEVRPD